MQLAIENELGKISDHGVNRSGGKLTSRVTAAQHLKVLAKPGPSWAAQLLNI